MSAENLRSGRVGRAATLQQRVAEDLVRLRNQLLGKDLDVARQQLAELRKLEGELQQIQQQIAALERETAGAPRDRVGAAREAYGPRRGSLADDAARVADQVEQLAQTAAAQTIRDAESQLRSGQIETRDLRSAPARFARSRPARA